ncbi:alpha/beta fold hydrolase [Nonomuraea sediminis]|uniref:alpha/beta fold hydrolase n=1 Tax=Nonomuraea sediminis TaxID=2835864 RepID=UPI001BDD7CE2|nr:alpha/beta hydrolase [Nonomuraea sediminis]
MLTVEAADGIEIRAHDEGQGPVVLVLHAGLDDGTQWQRVAGLLARRFRVVRIQRRQYRKDLRPACTMAQEADDALAVAATLGTPLLLVGHSSGAVVALEAMVRAPGTFAGSVLYEPPVVIGESLGREAVAKARAAAEAGRPVPAMRAFLGGVVRVPPAQAVLGALLIGAVPRMRALALRQVDDLVAIEALGDRLEAYAAIDVPTVLLGGETSPAHLGERLDALQARLPNCRRVVMPGQGHGAHVRSPESVARVIEDQAAEVLI